MPRPERFSETRQRRVLSELARSSAYLRTEEGVLLLEQIRTHLVPAILVEAGRMGLGSGWVSPDEIVHTAVVGLCAHEGLVADYASRAETEPWGYLFGCLRRWMREQWGVRGLQLEESLRLPHYDDTEGEVELVRLGEVIERIEAVLSLHTPELLRDRLRSLIEWFALNPPSRLSYEFVDCALARHHFPQFTLQQLAAVTNILWGGRPRRQETSLFAAFLLDEQFCPYESPLHARAILRYARTMRDSGSLQTSDRRLAA